MQRRNPALNVTVHESGADDGTPVDMKLVQIAKLLNVRLLTNDTGLARSPACRASPC
jgi:uncharacterized protein YacL